MNAQFGHKAPKLIAASTYTGTCEQCKQSIEVGTPIYWQSKRYAPGGQTLVWHQACYEQLNSGTPPATPAEPQQAPATPATPQPSQGEPMQNDPNGSPDPTQSSGSGAGGSGGEPKLRDQISLMLLTPDKMKRHLHKDDLLRMVANLRPYNRINWCAASTSSKDKIIEHIVTTTELYCERDEAAHAELHPAQRNTVLTVDRRLSEILLQKRQDSEAAQQAQREAQQARQEAEQAKSEAEQAKREAEERAKAAEEKAENAARVIEVKRPDNTHVQITGQHQRFADLLTLVSAGIPALMVGPAGGGKTHAAGLVAEHLGLGFTPLSLGPQTTQASVFGYSDATGGYVRTPFREAYEGGGLILLDELDRCNERVSVTLNAAIANGHCSFPDGTIERHENCYIIGAANTTGHGADRQYVSARQQDAALLDRFAVLDWQYDLHFESALAMATCEEHAERWTQVVRDVRAVVESLSLRYVVSPRATLQGLTLLKNGAPWALAVETVLFRGWNENDRHKVLASVEVAA